MKAFTLTLALGLSLGATAASAAGYGARVKALLTPQKSYKAPSAAIDKLGAKAFCGLRPGATVDEVVATWGKPTRLHAERRLFFMGYGDSLFSFDRSLGLVGCELMSLTPGLEKVTLSDLGLSMGMTKSDAESALGGQIERSGQLTISVTPNAAGLASVGFHMGEKGLWRMRFNVRALAGFKKGKVAPALTSAWGKSLRPLFRDGLASLPSRLGVLALNRKKPRVLGVSGVPDTDAVVAVWGTPTELGADGDKLELTYRFGKEAYLTAKFWSDRKTKAARARLTLKAGKNPEVAGLKVLPNKVAFGDLRKKVEKRLGKPSVNSSRARYSGYVKGYDMDLDYARGLYKVHFRYRP